MSDLISREAAIERIDEALGRVIKGPCGEKILARVPSAQPERKRGKWVIKDNPGTGWYRVTCSECGENVTSEIPMIGFIPNAKALWDYCPYCGARMEVDDETD